MSASERDRVPAPLRAGNALFAKTTLLVSLPVLAGAGAWVAVYLGDRGRPMPGRNNVFEHLYEHFEPSGLGLLVAVLALLLLLWRQSSSGEAPTPLEAPMGGLAERRDLFVILVSAAVLLAAGLGRRYIYFGLDLAMDEFASWFQSRVFVEGRLRALLDPAWAGFAKSLTPIFIAVESGSGTWASTYLPVFAFLRAGAISVSAEGLLNPLLTAISIPLLWAICGRVWPGERDAAVVGTVLLATSPQVLVNGMTGYAMPAHLAANLAWLLLWLCRGRASAVALPVLGGLAMGLHNPFPHALFVIPFLLASLKRWSRKRIAYTVIVYATFALVWWLWLREFHPQATDSAGPLAIFSRPGARQLLLQAMNVALVAAWQSPVSVLLVAVALSGRSRVEHAVRLAALGFLASFAFYLLFPASQGHGWGYRYVHGALGGWVLLGAAGYRVLRERLHAGAAFRLVRIGSLVVIGIVLPLRFLQVRSFTEPFATGMHLVSSIRADAVVVDTFAGWYARDLVRNDPFLRNRPVVLSAWSISAANRERLVRGDLGRVFFVGARALSSAGLTTFPGERAPRGEKQGTPGTATSAGR